MSTLPDPGFPGDQGEVSAELTAALEAYAADPDRLHRETLAVLQGERLLVPVVAVLGEVDQDEHGRAHEKTSEMATVLLRGHDGRIALLAFTGTAAMTRWDPSARPVPVRAAQAARAALDDGASALVIDLAGPVMVVVEDDDLRALAEGYRLAGIDGRYLWVKVAAGDVSGRGAGDTPAR
jgi:hypothetical protein